MNNLDTQGFRDGLWETNYISGNYVNGHKEGYFLYTFNAKKAETHSEGNYINDKKNGVWKYYDVNTKLMRKEFFL